MKKTISIDIAGQLFKIDEDAYELLKNYLNQVNERFGKEQGGEETISDIETRIAEIFGGGQEPPVVVSREMITDMISIMGAPEVYYDESSENHLRDTSVTRKKMYDPNSLSAKTGKVLSAFWKSVGRGFYLLFRSVMIVLGSFLSLLGFVLLFTFVVTLFFNGTPLVRDLFEPEIININSLLSIVLNTANVLPIIVLSAIVIIIPLSALTYLGIVMVFNLKNSSKWVGIIMFITWIISVAVLGVLLSAKLSVYSNRESLEQRNVISNPPDTITIAPLDKIKAHDFDELASIDNFSFFRETHSGNLCGSVKLNIYAQDSTESVFIIDRSANAKSGNEAWSNARQIKYNYKLSNDTIYLDEYFSIPENQKWYGSNVRIDLSLPEKTVIKVVAGTDMRMFGYKRKYDNNHFLIVHEYGYEEINE